MLSGYQICKMKGLKMKKLLIFVLTLTVVASCVAALIINASAEDNTYLDLRPVEDGDAEYSVTGADVEFKGNGTVVVTLTSTTATVSMIYKTSGTVNQEANVDVSVAKYVKYFFALSAETMTLDIHAHYDRGNKDNADLYLSGMRTNPDYLELGDATSKYGAWDIYDYLSSREGYLPSDNIIKFSDIVYTINGAVGDVFTLYNFEVAEDFDEDFGTVIPPDDDPLEISEDESSEEEVSEETSEATSEATSEEESEEEPVEESSQETSSGTTPTGDSGFVALAIISVIALAGAVVVKKR